MTMQQSITAAFEAVGGDIKALQGGVIVDSGQNGNGSWVRWGDGTLLCRHRMQIRSANGFATNAIVQTQQGWQFPQPMLVSPLPHLYITDVGQATAMALVKPNWFTYDSVSGKYLGVNHFRAINLGSKESALDINLMAWGRWK
ncbi:hypothetical protein [Allofranklinella schreckenbergeri]|nr:hypothetical protein [Allofranklinella schreckenbergeri]